MILRHQNYLRDHGRAVWGHLVEPNECQFSPVQGQVFPANVIYSPDTCHDRDLPVMQRLSMALLQLQIQKWDIHIF
jgi:hypothetical protein